MPHLALARAHRDGRVALHRLEVIKAFGDRLAEIVLGHVLAQTHELLGALARGAHQRAPALLAPSRSDLIAQLGDARARAAVRTPAQAERRAGARESTRGNHRIEPLDSRHLTRRKDARWKRGGHEPAAGAVRT